MQEYRAKDGRMQGYRAKRRRTQERGGGKEKAGGRKRRKKPARSRKAGRPVRIRV